MSRRCRASSALCVLQPVYRGVHTAAASYTAFRNWNLRFFSLRALALARTIGGNVCMTIEFVCVIRENYCRGLGRVCFGASCDYEAVFARNSYMCVYLNSSTGKCEFTVMRALNKVQALGIPLHNARLHFMQKVYMKFYKRISFCLSWVFEPV